MRMDIIIRKPHQRESDTVNAIELTFDSVGFVYFSLSAYLLCGCFCSLTSFFVAIFGTRFVHSKHTVTLTIAKASKKTRNNENDTNKSKV